jgi:hypothetical protein
MLNIKRLDRVTNSEIYRQIESATGKEIEPLTLQIQRRQLRYVGNCLRKAENELISKYVLYTPLPSHGTRGRGNPKMTYAEYIGRLINNDVLPSAGEIRKMANDRSLWRNRIVGGCKPKLFAVE